MCCGSKRMQLKSSAAPGTSVSSRPSPALQANANSQPVTGLRPTMGALPTRLRNALTQGAGQDLGIQTIRK